MPCDPKVFDPNEKDEQLLSKVLLILKALPPTNRALVMKLLRLLHRITEYSASNKMSAKNLSTCLSQIVFPEQQSERTLTDSARDFPINAPDKFSLAPGSAAAIFSAAIYDRVFYLMILHYLPIVKFIKKEASTKPPSLNVL